MRLEWLRDRRGIGAIAALALVARFGPLPAMLHLLPMSVTAGFADDGWAYYLPLARSLVERGEYAVLPGSPCISHVPLYPIVLAVALRIGGDSLLAITALQAGLGALLLLLTFAFTLRLFGPRAAALAVVLGALLPDLAVYSYLNLAENLSFVWFMATLLLILESLHRASFRWWAAVGVALGLAVLTREFFVTLLVPIAVWMGLTLGWTRALPRIAVLTGWCLLLLAPWTVRNFVRMGEFIPLTEKGGVNLYVGTLIGDYHPSDARRMWRIDDPRQQAVAERLKEDLARAHGPGERNRLYRRAAWENIRNDPWGQLRHLVRKALFFWQPNVGVRHAERIGHAGLLRAAEVSYLLCLLCAAGSLLLPGPKGSAYRLVLMLVAWTFGFHLLIGEAEPRYHVTILPLILALAGSSLAWTLQAFKRGAGQAP